MIINCKCFYEKNIIFKKKKKKRKKEKKLIYLKIIINYTYNI